VVVRRMTEEGGRKLVRRRMEKERERGSEEVDGKE
jgi:ribosomal protein L34